MRIRPSLAPCIVAAVLASTAAPTTSEAFSTRVHIIVANALHDALAEAGDGTIALRFGDHAVIVDPDDAEAILDNPLAFRAGAIGPDNMVFPGMADPSHALGQGPFEQCELLYEEALTGEEQAYALGCFLHGSTDAVAHHYVNYMSGETFTLTPITSERGESFDNVVRHILAESAIQKAAYALEPAAFSDAQLTHTIPIGFVLRAYLDTESPLWQAMSAHALGEYEAAVADNPGASLPTIVAAMDVAAADHLVLSPVYLGAVDQLIGDKRAELVAAVEAMQDPNTPEGSELLVEPGDDGELGTKDDETDCAFTCPNLYATYFTYVGLLAPRYNGQNEELPSAFDKISDELRAELDGFPIAYLETVENISGLLNTEPGEMDDGFGLSKDDLKAAFLPLETWSESLSTIDYDTLVYAVVPDWIVSLDTLLQSVGVDVDLAAIFAAIFDPIIQPIKDAIYGGFIAQAQVYLDQLVEEIDAKKEVVGAEYDARLAAAAHPDLGGDVLDHFYESGIYGHSFNIAAAAIANHAAVLPTGDSPGAGGAASFDASYSAAWMQAGACDYLQGAVFPLGVDVRGALSVRSGDTDYPAIVDEDAPVECHDGELSAFSDAPSLLNCALISLAELLDQELGSISRSYPPELAAEGASCEDVIIPGLPEPPAGTESDSDGSDSAGTGGSDSAGSDSAGTDGTSESEGGGVTAGETAVTTGPGADDAGEEDGCGCRADSPSHGGDLGWGLLTLLGLGVGRRRRRHQAQGQSQSASARGVVPRERGRGRFGGALALGVVLLGLGLSGCAGDDGTASASESGGTGAASTGGESAAEATGTEGGESATLGTTGTATSEGTEGTEGTDDTEGTDGETDTTEGMSDAAEELLAELDGTVWSGEQTRDGRTRAYELRFDGEERLWSELRNPYGPSRLREMRGFKVDDDGLTANSTVIQPQGWDVHPENGRKDAWTLEVLEGDPRILRTTRDGAVEEFVEGEWPAPSGGLTATVRVFKVGGEVDEAFCDSGASGFDYSTLFAFAHGDHPDIVATDVVAGAELLRWTDPSENNQFSINDVDGFDRLGGTVLSDTFNFMITYSGAIDHPGGELAMREADDAVEDAVWAFLGDDVGSEDEDDLFLEVHGFAWFDKTDDEPSASFPAGDLPFEAIVVRCTEAITDVDVEIRLPGDEWAPVGEVASTPVVDEVLFPPTF